MRLLLAATLWTVLGAAVGLGVYDLYVSRGAREYLQRAAEAELGRGPSVSMASVMTDNARAGAKAGFIWAAIVSGAGWVTIAAARTGVLERGDQRER